MSPTIFVHVRPKSCVRKRYGAKSSSSGFLTATYAVPASNDEASIWLTRPRSGMSFGVTFVHVLPPSRVPLTTPSSDPPHLTYPSYFPRATQNTTTHPAP